MNKKIFICYLFLFSMTLFCAEEWPVGISRRKRSLNTAMSSCDTIREKQRSLNLQLEKLKEIFPQLGEEVARTCANYQVKEQTQDVDGDENMGVDSEGYSSILEEGIAISKKQSNLDLQLKELEKICPQLVKEIKQTDEELTILYKIKIKQLETERYQLKAKRYQLEAEIEEFVPELKNGREQPERETKRLKTERYQVTGIEELPLEKNLSLRFKNLNID